MPAAEVDITDDLVRALLAEQHPDLADLAADARGANGWDNAIFRLGDDLVVRMPRRQLGANLVEHEHRWLPELAGRLPIPIPAPVRDRACRGAASRGAGACARASTARSRPTSTLAEPTPGGASASGSSSPRCTVRRRRTRRSTSSDGASRSPSSSPASKPTSTDLGPTLVRPGPSRADRSDAVRPAGRTGRRGRVGRAGAVGARRPALGEPDRRRRLDHGRDRLRRHHLGRPGRRPRGRPGCCSTRPIGRCSGRPPAASRPVDDATWQRGQLWALHFAVLYLLHSADAPASSGWAPSSSPPSSLHDHAAPRLR